MNTNALYIIPYVITTSVRNFVGDMLKSQNEFVAFFETLLAEQRPFVMFRLPQTQKIVVYQQLEKKHHQTKTLTENGFVFAPFLTKESYTFIPNQKEEHFVVPYDTNTPLEKKVVYAQNKSYYKELVAAAQNVIKQSNLKKVVVSRQHIQPYTGSVATSFLKLTQVYPDAMVYYWSHPHTGNWIGATPETLLHIQKGICRTMALAGTLPYKENHEPEWTAKELDEQQMVTDFIQKQLEQCFPKNSIKLSPTYTKRAGNLLHLCANFEVPLGNTTTIELMRLLHPTPAVAGVPVNESLSFLATHETHNRSYYAGVLGPITSDNVHLYVNLRCATVMEKSLILYVGGGITEQSDAEMEWAESQRKAETLLSVL